MAAGGFHHKLNAHVALLGDPDHGHGARDARNDSLHHSSPLIEDEGGMCVALRQQPGHGDRAVHSKHLLIVAKGEE